MPEDARTLDLLSAFWSKPSAMLSALSDVVLQVPCDRDVVWLGMYLERAHQNKVLILTKPLVPA